MENKGVRLAVVANEIRYIVFTTLPEMEGIVRAGDIPQEIRLEDIEQINILEVYQD